MTDGILLATDLDRTVLPNGPQTESTTARPLLRALTQHPEVTLVYVSGRGEVLLKEAIETYDIPVPAYAIGDVGTTIFVTHDGSWKPLKEWQDTIAPDWKGNDWSTMKALFDDIDTLTLQEDSKQNTYKLSYYAPEDADKDVLIAAMQQRLDRKSIHASLIWSIDESAHTGLMDVLPRSSTKLGALRFLMEFLGFSEEHTVFCGDSGNDLPVLTSGLKVVLVKNAHDAVRKEVLTHHRAHRASERLYVARGDFLGMNGNYAAGVLEGTAHFFPELEKLMTNL